MTVKEDATLLTSKGKYMDAKSGNRILMGWGRGAEFNQHFQN